MNSQSVTGAIRTAVQNFFGSLVLMLTPLATQVDLVAELDAAGKALAALVVGLVVGLYWLVLNAVQTHPAVQGNPVLAAIVAGLMGGKAVPNYEDGDS